MNFKDLGVLLGAFIVIFVGVVLVNSVADTVYLANTISTVTGNETIVMTAGTGEVANDDVTALTYFGNATDNTNNGNNVFVIGESVNVTKATGVIVVNQSAGGNYNVTYEYEGTEYLANSQARTLIGLVTLFFVLAIVLVGYNLVSRSYSNL